MLTTYDYVILGAGASGLMMAYRMSLDPFFDKSSILIVDKEQKNTNDRTWCFWEEKSGEWDDVVSKCWSSIYFSSATIKSTENISPYQYKMIRSKDFYNKIWQSLANKKNITFLQEAVKSIDEVEGRVKVLTASNTILSKRVINSILLSDEYLRQDTYPVLQQHFVGFFIKTKDPIFDESLATFMDFDIPQKQNTRFMYVLPTSKTEALFEYTLFSSDVLPYNEYKVAIEEYLSNKGILHYEIIEKEQGSIPMTSYKFWKKNSENIIHIGTAGGWTKASTGFTFKNTSAKTTQLVNFIKKEASFTKFYKVNKFWFYDLLLLDILKEKNQLGSILFSKMFQKSKSKKILKFLDEQTSFLEDLQIVLKMPPYNFVRALLRRIF